MKRKLVVNDGRSEREVLLVGPIVIGRDPSCHISDLDPLLSRRHAEFLPGPKGLLVRDLGSRNGILVNGAKVPERMLVPGDVVQLGHLQLRYLEEETTELHALRQSDDTEQHDSATMLPTQNRAQVPTSVGVNASGAADVTVAPAARRPTDTNIDVTRLTGQGVGVETTRLASPSSDTTRLAVPSTDTTLQARVPDNDDDTDTHVPIRTDDDETMAPHSSSLARAMLPDEAHLVLDANLVVQSTSATGQVIFGVRPDMLVGRTLSEAVERSVRVLSSAKGRPTLALFATRNESDKSIKMTFKAGQAVEPVR